MTVPTLPGYPMRATLFARTLFLAYAFTIVSRMIRPGTSTRRHLHCLLLGLLATMILRAVLPYLVIKREQAEVALAIIDTMQRKRPGVSLTPEVTAQREAMVIQLKALKRLPIQEVS